MNKADETLIQSFSSTSPVGSASPEAARAPVRRPTSPPPPDELRGSSGASTSGGAPPKDDEPRDAGAPPPRGERDGAPPARGGLMNRMRAIRSQPALDSSFEGTDPLVCMKVEHGGDMLEVRLTLNDYVARDHDESLSKAVAAISEQKGWAPADVRVITAWQINTRRWGSPMMPPMGPPTRKPRGHRRSPMFSPMSSAPTATRTATPSEYVGQSTAEISCA